jgi:hypothetical protein
MVRSSDEKVILKDMRKSIERAVDTLLDDINTEVIKTTPIRTGRARSGWRYSPRYKLGYQGALIQNRVEYIGILDRGSSKQAPNGIVEPAIDKFIRRNRKI